ncbi:hypothetical protein CERSUDRAFT_69622 [Gelatoporia subvermispora B]|uniref:T6SS Phospholipase effector Tle1-like catalytic domain-containing protein n=1 Tax=Ceriporiopsis subvermispora (strain B) TaxID=914234 RepID=M2P6V1_CERS8|nr:hypothetical protein CERSUDRAFT_69622 [Gelatoporia subvermispora B]
MASTTSINTACNPDEDYDVIPPHHDRRTLVLCFDGTGDQFDADNSNIIMLFSMLQKDDPSQQMVYYQAGIGTYTPPQIATPQTASMLKTLDEALAIFLDAHVMGGYRFLMQNYRAGDKICLFGFSRGAYTARALAGMVHKVGLLPRDNDQQVPFAYHMFCRTDAKGWEQSTAFKKAFSMDVEIDFIGVWDTVCSVGLFPKSLPFVSSNRAIKTFRQALSLDEHRAKFKANHWNEPEAHEKALGTQPGEMPSRGTSKAKQGNSNHDLQVEMDDGHNETDVLEVWFAGCHCDVGGGSVPNDSEHNLARIPLRWMIREIFKANVGIRFHADLLRKIGLNPDTLYPYVLARPPAVTELPVDITNALEQEAARKAAVQNSAKKGKSKQLSSVPGDALLANRNIHLTEEQEDFVDAHCPIYDELSLARWWWILELLPLQHRHQKPDGGWKRYWSINLGEGRTIPDSVDGNTKFLVHRSVKTRLEAQTLQGGSYKWKAIFPAGAKEVKPTWVD